MSAPGRKGPNRTIVDVADWGRSEVSGIAEGKMHTSSSPMARGGARVTSIRSSLFKKAAGAKGVPSASTVNTSAGVAEEERSNQPGALIFKDESEAGDMDRPLTHADNESLNLCPFGRENRRAWAKDIFALIHNGLRCELKDLSTMLHALKSIRGNVTTTEYADFRRWWSVFSSLVSDYVSLETNVVVPWVEECMIKSENSDPKAKEFLDSAPGRLKTLKGASLAIGKLFCIICDDIPAALRAKAPPKQKVASSIMLHVDRFITLLVDFMWEEEMQLSNALSKTYDEKWDREKVMTKIITHMTDGSTSRIDEWLVLQTRWMSDPLVSRAHIRQISVVHGFSPVKILTNYEMQHAGIVQVMKVKADM